MSDGEVGMMWQVNYSLVDRGDGKRCAWCDKKVNKIKDLDTHLEKHMAIDKYKQQLREKIEGIPEKTFTSDYTLEEIKYILKSDVLKELE